MQLVVWVAVVRLSLSPQMRFLLVAVSGMPSTPCKCLCKQSLEGTRTTSDVLCKAQGLCVVHAMPTTAQHSST